MAKNKDVPEGNGPHAGWKKLLYGASILISFVGSLVLLAFTFLINDALDKTRDLTLTSVEGIQGDLAALDNALAGAEQELNVVNDTLSGLQGAFTPLESGLRKTGDSIESLADAASSIPLIGPTVPTTALKEASGSMKAAAAELGQTAATFDAHKTTMGELQSKVGEIRQTVSAQRTTLAQTATSIEDVFGLIKLANFLFFLVVISMFSMLVINSAAGLL
jgi:septal ring factor EnvC (AmiA/AmiB activator)